MLRKIIVRKGDITKMHTDVIVNAANPTLLGGGGVDGTIHAAAGPGLLEECRKIGGITTGEAVMTYGYDLPAPKIIHAVGPDCRVCSRKDRAILLQSAWKNSLSLADLNGANSIAFPSISTGIYAYPLAEAAFIAIQTVREFLRTEAVCLKEVHIVCFDDETFSKYSHSVHTSKDEETISCRDYLSVAVVSDDTEYNLLDSEQAQYDFLNLMRAKPVNNLRNRLMVLDYFPGLPSEKLLQIVQRCHELNTKYGCHNIVYQNFLEFAYDIYGEEGINAFLQEDFDTMDIKIHDFFVN